MFFRCEFWVNASSPDGDEIQLRSKGRAGYLLSPRHTLPPNTTCTWHFIGQPGDFIWLYFTSFVHEMLIPVREPQETGPTANKTPKTPGKRFQSGYRRFRNLLGVDIKIETGNLILNL